MGSSQKIVRTGSDQRLSLLTAEDIWFKYDLYLQFIPPINIWNICIDLRPFLKCKEGPFSRSWRSPRSNNLEIQNDKNSKWKLVKPRWNPKSGLSDLENDLLTSTTSELAQQIFSKITILNSGDQAEKNELLLGFLVKLLKFQTFSYFLVASRTER